MGQNKVTCLKSTMSAQYTTTNSWANITGLVLPPIPEDGFYDIIAQGDSYSDAAGDSTYTRLAVNGNPINGTEHRSSVSQANAVGCPFINIEQGIYLKKGDVVSCQAIYGTTSTLIQYSSGVQVSSIKAIKR